MYHRPVTATAFRVPPAYPDVALPEEEDVVTEGIGRSWLPTLVPELPGAFCLYAPSTSSDVVLLYLCSWFEAVSEVFEREEVLEHVWLRYAQSRQVRRMWTASAALEQPPASPGQVPSKLESTLDDLASDWVHIPRRADVRQYLAKHPDMIALVGIVSRRTAQRFGEDGEVSLEIYKDPEFKDEYLTLNVRQWQYDQTVLDAINDLRTAYSGELAEKSGWLLVTTDFQAPR